MILIALAALATFQTDADANRAVNAAVRAWGACVGARVTEPALGSDPPEAVAEAAATGCGSFLDHLHQVSIPLMGEEQAAGFVANMRAGMVTSMTRRVVEIRAGTLDRSRPDAIHAACIRIQAGIVAAPSASPDALADRAVAACADEERAAVAAFHPDNDEETATITAELRSQSRALVRQLIEMRAGR